MPVINREEGWLFLDEPHTGSQACIEALLEIPGSKLIGKQHQSWPSLLADGWDLRYLRTFSVVRDPFDIITTLATLSKTVPYWLIRKYRHRDPFFTHQCNTTLRYECGLQFMIEEHVGHNLDFEIINKTPDKIHWGPMFTQEDYRFACATIPELFTLNYVPWGVKNSLRAADIDDYIKKHGDQEIHT